MRVLVMAVTLTASPLMAQAQVLTPPSAVISDQSADLAHPPQLQQVRYPTGGVEVPARFFVAAGAGRHPTVLLLHGIPGTELNLDLARAMQRAGWNVLAIHYRGLWGAPGQFSFNNSVEDARAALAWLRDPARAELVDTSRIVVLGHSMGGFDTVMIGDDPDVAGFVAISAANLARLFGPLNTQEARETGRADWKDDTSYTNTTYDALFDEAQASQAAWNWRRNAAEMTGRPVLVVVSDDALEEDGDAVVSAISEAGGPAPKRVKFHTDHSYNDHRIALASAVVTWLQTIFP